MPRADAMIALTRRVVLPKGLFVRLVGVAVGLFVVSVGFAVHRVANHFQGVQGVVTAVYWDANQGSLEALRLQVALDALRREPGSADALDAVEVRLGVLLNWTRNLVRQRTRRNALTPPVNFGEVDQAAFVDQLAQLEQAMDAVLRGEREAIGRADLLLDSLGGSLRELNRLGHFDVQTKLGQIEDAADSLASTLQITALGLLFSGGLFVLQLAATARRLRRALSEQTELKDRAGKAEATLRTLVDSLPILVAAVDPQGRVLLVNDAHERFHGLAEAPSGHHRAEAIGLDEVDLAALARARGGNAPVELAERELTDAAGDARTLLVRVVPVNGPAGEARSTLRVALDITERKRSEERIRHLAEHDLLTGLPNRVRFADQLTDAIRLCHAEGGRVALHCLDLDRFKEVNDTLGHPVGDQLLVAAAARMRACLRPGDVVARLSGDEFAVIQTSISDSQQVERLAARLCAELGRPYLLDGVPVRSGGSVGIAIAPDHGITPELLLQRADIALYRVKERSRGRFSLFDSSMETEIQQRRMIEGELRSALEQGQLSLAYQPKFSLPDLAPAGCEALLRWQHPTRGPVSPAVFVPIAEQAGLTLPMSRFVLREACRQILAWQAQGFPVPVAVNLSAQHFTAGQAASLVEEALTSSGAPAGLLMVEVTESVFIGNAEAAARDIAALGALGVKVALDDFGTGYSTLGTLHRFRFDQVKIDRSFVEALRQSDPKAPLLIDAIIRLAHSLGAEAVAEGVEKQVELEHLQRLGCDHVQGFLLGRPGPPGAMSELLARHRKDGAVPEPLVRVA